MEDEFVAAKPLFGRTKFLLPKKASNIKSERAEIISKFVEKINRERMGTIYAQITPRVVAIKIGHLKDNMELYHFYKMCCNAKNGFGRCFFGALKPKD